MSDSKRPYIARVAQPVAYTRPGLHSHNRRRQQHAVARTFGALYRVRLLLIMIGLAALGYYGYTLGDQYVYQAYQNWAFDQGIAGRQGVTFADFLRERTPFGFVVGKAPSVPVPSTTTQTPKPEPTAPPRPAPGAVLGRIEIARLNLAAMVREGVDAKVLSVAVGHVPSTALPGQPGNFAIAAHRDTLFRALKDIHEGDLVTFESPSGTYTYKVAATKIVKPTNVSVLQPDGGGLIPETRLVSSNGQPNRLLTMITCYPFYYVGSAPKRFIVEAELVGGNDGKGPPRTEVSDSNPVNGHSASRQVQPHRTATDQAALSQPSRHSGRAAQHLEHVEGGSSNSPTPRKKSFWRRLLHV